MALLNSYPEAPISRTTVIDRPRLREKLELAQKHSLTLLTAPPGYGKTTLAAQFAHQTAYPVIWHTVEERERDFPNLTMHAITALSDVVPNLRELDMRGGSTPGEAAGLIADRLRADSPDDLVYIFDDAHHLVGSPGAEAWLRSLIALLPPSCHLVLMGRVLPSLSLADKVLRQDVLVFGLEQLRFTAEETRELAEAIGLNLSGNEVDRITVRLEGWPAGTILALQPAPVELEAVLFEGANRPEAFFDTLAELMVKAQPPTLRDFLLVSSTLSRITPDLCHTVLRLPHSLERFTEVLNRNLFVSEVSGSFVYHPLFRNFLQRQLQVRQPALFLDLHLQAGCWFEENNQLENAFEHYLSADRPKRAAAIAERAAQAYHSQGKIETLLYWASRLRQAATQAPRLLYSCAMVHTDRYQYDLALAKLDEAEHGFQGCEDQIELIKVGLLRANIDNQRGNYHKAAQQAERIVQLAITPPNLQGFALYILGTATLNCGDVQQSLNYLEAALPLFRETGDTYSISVLLQQLEVAYIFLGRFPQAAACLQEAVAIQRSLGNAKGLAMALNNLGYHYHMLGDYQQALITFQEGLSVATRSPEKRPESFLLWSMGDLLRDRGDFLEASQLYRKALEIIGEAEPTLQCSVIISLSTLQRWQGMGDEALALAIEAESLANSHEAGLEKMKAGIAKWAAQAEIGNIQLAREALDKLSIDLRQRQLYPQLAQVSGLCAYSALLDSDKVSARKYLKMISSTITHHANLQPLISEIMHTPLLKEFIARQRTKYPDIHEGVRRLEDAQIVSPAERKTAHDNESSPTYSLRIWCLGQVRIERDGKLVLTSDWQATTARELFFYLLFKGASTREMISLTFWPDDSPQQVRSNFHTTLHRARQAVGGNVIRYQDDLYFINPEINLWCDAHELQTLVREARLLPAKTAHTENLWRRAVELYRSEFLPFTFAEWADSLRSLLQESYLVALVGLANAARAREQLPEAIGTLKRALQIDPYREEMHRNILICYAEQGERHLLIKHLDDLKNLLWQELGVNPSEETLSLATKLLGRT